MMDYEIFRGVMKDKILDYLPENYKNGRVEIHEVQKVNECMDALTVFPEGESRIAPNIYLSVMYEDYKQHENIEKSLQDAAKVVEVAMKENKVSNIDVDKEFTPDKVYMVLVNKEQNREMLAKVPHRDFQDLAVIYRWLVDKSPDGIMSTIITDGIAERIGMTEEQLFMHSVENTKELFPPKIQTMDEVIMEMMDMDREFAEAMGLMADRDPKETMWVLTNERGLNGAVSMLYEENLQKIANRVGTDMYILPSSTHETILVSVEMGDAQSLAEMVNEINMSQVELKDRLSNNVYHYDKDLRKVTLATDSPNKRLDGMVSEPPMIYQDERSR